MVSIHIIGGVYYFKDKDICHSFYTDHYPAVLRAFGIQQLNLLLNIAIGIVLFVIGLLIRSKCFKKKIQCCCSEDKSEHKTNHRYEQNINKV